MAIYHLSVKNIGRSSGKSAVASSAYRSGEKLVDEETGLIHDFTRKGGVEYSEIMLCKNAPEEYQDRETLWNAVQKIEKSKDARLAREIEVALPRELSREKQITCIREYVSENFTSKGMCSDWSIHDKGDGNPHAHIMLTTRAIKENGTWAPKSKKVYDLDENGNKIPQIDKKTGLQKVDKQNRKQWKNHKEDYTDWNRSEKVEEWRSAWAEQCNKYLARENQIDHRSYERQGVEQLPTIHEGYVARKIGEKSERIQYNNEVREANREIKSIEIKEKIYEKEVARIKEQIKEKARELHERLRGLRGRFGVGRTGRSGEKEVEGISGEAERREQQTNELEHEVECREQEANGINQGTRQREQEAERRERATEQREQSHTKPQNDHIEDFKVQCKENIGEVEKEPIRANNEPQEQIEKESPKNNSEEIELTGQLEKKQKEIAAIQKLKGKWEKANEIQKEIDTVSAELKAEENKNFLKRSKTKIEDLKKRLENLEKNLERYHDPRIGFNQYLSMNQKEKFLKSDIRNLKEQLEKAKDKQKNGTKNKEIANENEITKVRNRDKTR